MNNVHMHEKKTGVGSAPLTSKYNSKHIRSRRNVESIEDEMIKKKKKQNS